MASLLGIRVGSQILRAALGALDRGAGRWRPCKCGVIGLLVCCLHGTLPCMCSVCAATSADLRGALFQVLCVLGLQYSL